jgi:hypothetical protein
MEIHTAVWGATFDQLEPFVDRNMPADVDV